MKAISLGIYFRGKVLPFLYKSLLPLNFHSYLSESTGLAVAALMV